MIDARADHGIVVVQDSELTARDAEHGLGEIERESVSTSR